MKIVYRAGDITEAEIVKGMLLSYDIEAHVSGFYLQGGIGETVPQDLAKVHVADEDYEEARRLVLEYEGTASAQDDNANEISSFASSREPTIFITTLVVVVIFVLSYWFGL